MDEKNIVCFVKNGFTKSEDNIQMSIKEILKVKDKKLQRYMLQKLCSEGDFVKNIECVKAGSKPLTACSSKLPGLAFPCPNCIVFYSSKSLSAHAIRCNKMFNGKSSLKDAKLFFELSITDDDKFKD